MVGGGCSGTTVHKGYDQKLLGCVAHGGHETQEDVTDYVCHMMMCIHNDCVGPCVRFVVLSHWPWVIQLLT